MKKMIFILLFFCVLLPVRALSQRLQENTKPYYLMIAGSSGNWMYWCFSPPDNPHSDLLRCEVFQRNNKFKELAGFTAKTRHIRGLFIDYYGKINSTKFPEKSVFTIKIREIPLELFKLGNPEIEVDEQRITQLNRGKCDGDYCDAIGVLTNPQI